jgi:hypothetical protein
MSESLQLKGAAPDGRNGSFGEFYLIYSAP